MRDNLMRIGLTLGGGGARGLSHIRFIQVLDELNITPSVISGTSIGAIIGAFYAAGMSGSQMIRLLYRIGLPEIGRMVDFNIFGRTALLKGRGVEGFLHKHIPANTFQDLKIPLKIVTTDFWRRKQIVLESGALIPAIRASMSLPGLFEPVRIGNTVLIDGGAVNPVPCDIIRGLCDLLIAIDVSGGHYPDHENAVPGMFDSIMSTFDIMMASIMENQMKSVRPDIIIRPDLSKYHILDFHLAEKIIEGVDADVDRFRMTLRQHLDMMKGRSFWKKRRKTVND